MPNSRLLNHFQYIGLICDDSRHYLDHLAPFCALKGWPLVVCDVLIEELAQRYYPDLQLIFIQRWDLAAALQDLVIVSCEPKSVLEFTLGYPLKNTILWLPHGNSDKGWKAPFFEALQKEDTALVYGQKMIDFMRQRNVFCSTIRMGNFRWKYWKKHQLFYEKIIQEQIPLQPPIYLYAPTWKDTEDNGSFWQTFPPLAEHLPKTHHLIVKVHPNTYAQELIEIEKTIGQAQKKKNIFFLIDFPPIYPLLNICDAYIGDMSSVGYDFLAFNRAMFFINAKRLNSQTDPSLFLYRCGKEIYPEQIPSLFSLKKGRFTKIRKKIYDYTFDPSSSIEYGKPLPPARPYCPSCSSSPNSTDHNP